jgi:hypothetical protein
MLRIASNLGAKQSFVSNSLLEMGDATKSSRDDPASAWGKVRQVAEICSSSVFSRIPNARGIRPDALI